MIPCPHICPVCSSRNVTLHSCMPTNAIIAALSRIGSWLNRCHHIHGHRETVYIRCRDCGHVSRVDIL